jgi:signal transduction histidine kinase
VPPLLERAARAYRPLAQKQGVGLRIEAQDRLPEIQADPERMVRVLGNLLSNSLRYTPEGGEIVLQARAGEADCVLISVADNGKGIPAEALPYIFDRLYRVDPARSGGDESGLGLAIARGIVEAHGGSISAESAPGVGTTITIELPV